MNNTPRLNLRTPYMLPMALMGAQAILGILAAITGIFFLGDRSTGRGAVITWSTVYTTEQAFAGSNHVTTTPAVVVVAIAGVLLSLAMFALVVYVSKYRPWAYWGIAVVEAIVVLAAIFSFTQGTSSAPLTLGNMAIAALITGWVLGMRTIDKRRATHADEATSM